MPRVSWKLNLDHAFFSLFDPLVRRATRQKQNLLLAYRNVNISSTTAAVAKLHGRNPAASRPIGLKHSTNAPSALLSAAHQSAKRGHHCSITLRLHVSDITGIGQAFHLHCVPNRRPKRHSRPFGFLFALVACLDLRTTASLLFLNRLRAAIGACKARLFA